MFFGLVFEQRGEAVELPSVEFLVATLAPTPRVTVLVLPNLAQVTDGDTTDIVVNALFNDVLGEGVQKVVFPTREFLSNAERTA